MEKKDVSKLGRKARTVGKIQDEYDRKIDKFNKKMDIIVNRLQSEYGKDSIRYIPPEPSKRKINKAIKKEGRKK